MLRKFLRPALTALILCVVLAAPAVAQPATTSPKAEAENPHDFGLPYNAIICSARDRSGQPLTERLDVPPGKKPTDICPKTAITYLIYPNTSVTTVHLPVVLGAAMPVDGDSP